MIDRYFVQDIWERCVPDPDTSVTFKSLLYSNDATQTFASYTIPYLKNRPADGGEQNASGVVSDSLPDRNWEIWRDWLNSAVDQATGQPAVCPNPKVGDRIVDADGYTWEVQEFKVNLFNAVYVLPCKRVK